MAAVDLLYKELCEQESKGTIQDRYNSFYGWPILLIAYCKYL
jgi:hypothetical protein